MKIVKLYDLKVVKSLFAACGLLFITCNVFAQQDTAQRPNIGGNNGLIRPSLQYDPVTNTYNLNNSTYGYSTGSESMNFDEYSKYSLNKATKDYWKEKASNQNGVSGRKTLLDLVPKMRFNKGDFFKDLFNSDLLKLKMNLSAEIRLGILYNRRDDPALDVKAQRQTDLDFTAKINANVDVRIADKFDIKIKHNTEALFAFDNTFKTQYEGKEDDIVKLVQVGNIDFNPGTQLIQSSQNLFGFKTTLQFGKTYITGVFSEQRSESKNIQIQGGAQSTPIDIKADNYEDDKHFFIAHYFRENFSKALKTLPVINSNINIIKIELWVTNIGAAVTNNRNIVAFTDLGESKPLNSLFVPNPGSYLPDNEVNNLPMHIDLDQIRNINTAGNYLTTMGLVSGQDYEKLENARLLPSNEYDFNRKLGFISLKTRLNNDQVLAVAFQYQIVGDPTVYQVGEFSDGGLNAPNSLRVKLLKSSSRNTKSPLWRLMMKNIYTLNSYQISSQDFRLNIVYAGDEQGIKSGYFKTGPKNGVPLIRLFGMDRLDAIGNREPDGVFDFVNNAFTEGGLIEAKDGRFLIPYPEPFGHDLIEIFDGDSIAAVEYMFQELYDNTKIEAQNYPKHNKYYFDGWFKSAQSNEIMLGSMNIPQGSVKVMAGNIPLTENIDYTVDYMLGRVRIINEGIINSGTPISVSCESNEMFNMMTKRMIGLRVEHKFNDHLHIGATFENMHQSPITQKVNIGEEPISNTIWGFDVSYDNESRILTNVLDKILPFEKSKTMSRIKLFGEFAHFIPGVSRGVGEKGTIYIDDFESSKSSYNLKDHHSWYLASVPQWQQNMFPEAYVANDSPMALASGFNRAKLAWYIIDRSVFYESGVRPKNISNDDLSDPYAREVTIKEIFPNRDIESGQLQTQSTLNLAFYPEERGPYNYDVAASPYSSGINGNGLLVNPASRWGGVMRKIDNTDFESNNVEYIEFWMMDPFINPDGVTQNTSAVGGKLYFNLGDISEDVLKDGRKSFEHGLPTTAVIEKVDTTPWGWVPQEQAIVNAFDSDPASRPFQDVGYDGLSTENERTFFENFLDNILLTFGPTSQAVLDANNDPSSDNYHHYRGTDYDQITAGRKILDRYKNYSNPDGNSQDQGQNGGSYSTQATTLPNMEDINGDNTLNEAENYYQYEVEIKPDKMRMGENYITDIQTSHVKLKNGDMAVVNWYQFKIPIRQPDRVVGNISSFQSIRFMRMFMREFTEPTFLRFATLELVRSEWRKFNGELLDDNAYTTSQPNTNTEFNVSVVNVEENGYRQPIPYVVPPGIERQVNYGSQNLTKQNEQALSIQVRDLADGDARALYKITDLDIRQFKHLKMFVHAEKMYDYDDLQTGDLTVFVRLGADFENNYYEYEIPLTFTSWGSIARMEIWPSDNDIDIDLEKLVQLKVDRNTEVRDPNNNRTYNQPYIWCETGANGQCLKRYKVMGTPSISAVKMMMIGVRNPKKMYLHDTDNGHPISAEIWLNEFRASDFTANQGWAAKGIVQATLGDVGNVNTSVSYTSANFNSLETKITNLQQNNVFAVDFSTNLELGRFLPEKIGLKIPFHYDYSRNLNNPEYNPLDPDVKTNIDLRTYAITDERDAVKRKIQDNIVRHNVNIINFHKEYKNAGNSGTNRNTGNKGNSGSVGSRDNQGTGGSSNSQGGQPKHHFWDIENFNASYSYSSIEARNVDWEYDNKYHHNGQIAYNYTFPTVSWEPFKKLKNKKGNDKNQAINKVNPNTRGGTSISKPSGTNNWLSIFTDFNMSPLPKSFQFSTMFDRHYNEAKIQNKSLNDILIEPTFYKTFDWTRNYDLKWDFMKGLNFAYNATAVSFLEEPRGKIDTKEERDSVWHSFWRGGKLNSFIQNTNINWTVPINKIPLFDWVTASANYTTSFRFTKGPNAVPEVGNTIENSRAMGGKVNLDFLKLYNKSKFLKDINTPKRNTANNSRNGNNGKPRPGEKQDDTKDEKSKGKQVWEYSYRGFLRFLMMIRSAGVEYRMTDVTILPGYMEEPDLLGLSFKNGLPGLPFAFGDQRDIRDKVIAKGMMSKDSLQNNFFEQRKNRNFMANVVLEPFQNFKIQVNAAMQSMETRSEIFKFDYNTNEFGHFMPVIGGNYNITIIALKTAFARNDKNKNNNVYQQFLDIRPVISERLSAGNPNSVNGGTFIDSISGERYHFGFGPTSQEVLINAFVAAYTGQDPNNFKIRKSGLPGPRIPLPNWSFTYDISKFKSISKVFNKFALRHSYASSYSIGSYARNIKYQQDANGFATGLDLAYNLIGERMYGSVTISEQFNPLIKFDIETKNNILFNVEMKRNRSLTLAFSNNQITEINDNAYVFGAGYVIKNVGFNVHSGGNKRKIQSDINLKAAVSIRQTLTLLRKIDQFTNTPSAGNTIITLNFSADYKLNENFIVTLYYDQTMNTPQLTTMVYTSTIQSGLSLKFNFNQ
ncbi:MAG: cell surface protein SprA [Bacteroidales bacterium]|nr:cell surface protein SprA [Bacteroidales bacterium]